MIVCIFKIVQMLNIHPIIIIVEKSSIRCHYARKILKLAHNLLFWLTGVLKTIKTYSLFRFDCGGHSLDHLPWPWLCVNLAYVLVETWRPEMTTWRCGNVALAQHNNATSRASSCSKLVSSGSRISQGLRQSELRDNLHRLTLHCNPGPPKWPTRFDW